MEWMWILVLLVVGLMMLFRPELMFKIENLLITKNGEPTEFYLMMMRLGGLFFTICSIVVIFYLLTR